MACSASAVGATGPGWGKIFYVDMNRPVGSQCFEAAPNGWNGGADPKAEWGCYPQQNGWATGVGIGTGEANTLGIVNRCGAEGIAARLADDYAGGSQTDWFLPSKDELNQLSTQLATVGGLDARGDYWSSSQHNESNAWYQQVGVGDGPGWQGTDIKFVSLLVRPVRAF